MGPGRAAEIIREGLYRGADGGYLLTDRAFAGADTLATSYALATAIKKIGDYDIIIGGRQAIDGDTAQVGPQVAEKLGINTGHICRRNPERRRKESQYHSETAYRRWCRNSGRSAAYRDYGQRFGCPCRPRNAKLVMKYKRALGAQEKVPAPPAIRKAYRHCHTPNCMKSART